jgi:hypothetical protein
MASKGLFMWEQVVCSIGKHSMGMALHRCQHFERVHLVHGVVVSAAAVKDPRKKRKVRMKFAENQDMKT